MLNSCFSQIISICIIGTVGTITIIYYKNISNFINKTFSDKNIQTDLNTNNNKIFDNKEIQCEMDITELEKQGKLEIVQTSSKNYRWFMLKSIGIN